jgi:hypothetical protein
MSRNGKNGFRTICRVHADRKPSLTMVLRRVSDTKRLDDEAFPDVLIPTKPVRPFRLCDRARVIQDD